MKLGTRLLLFLIPIVSAVMLVYTWWALEQRERVILSEARRETEAYATALAFTVEHAFEDLGAGGVRAIIDEVSRQSKIYGILVYGPDGVPLLTSASIADALPAPVSQVRSVLDRGVTITLDRELAGERVLAVLRPIRRADGSIRGALEVTQQLDLIEAEQRRIQQRYLLNTVTLLVVLGGVILWLVRKMVSAPVARFAQAARDLGGGKLGHRIPEQLSGELGELAAEFNLMASRLERAREELLKEAENRVALERQLRQSEKMAAIGKLAASVAHEIAAPLNVISGRAEMLLASGRLSADQERQLRIIVNQIGRISTIVRNLLDFARRREPRRRSIDLTAVLDGAIDFLENEFASRQVHVTREYSPPLWLDADPDQLHQVAVNLLLNAVQALEATTGERSITIRARATGAGVEVEICDTGPGIGQGASEQIFEPFFTTKPQGTGLGLAVVRSIVEDHGGTIEVSNRSDGPGAIFRLFLPAVTAPVTHA
ncbi:Sensor protein ZraS [bacterium HR33]|nr:Sensor protein ZraS [bacterium HR33]